MPQCHQMSNPDPFFPGSSDPAPNRKKLNQNQTHEPSLDNRGSWESPNATREERKTTSPEESKVTPQVSPAHQPEVSAPTIQDQQLHATHLQAAPESPPANETKVSGSGSRSDLQGVDVKINRIIVGLREMLCRFTISEEMYLELAVIVRHNYPTNRERVEAVQRKLSLWKESGILRLRTSKQ
ncbi:hypothetical protein AAMO2058_001074100 [Amorphochlora amoebiformis]|eukprot:318314-Amorphochlora_amoeboformis.AAC.1